MKKLVLLAATAGLMSLGACHKSPQDAAADNIEANADAMADNLEAAADNTDNAMQSNMLDNQADAVRNEGDMKAKDMKTDDPDTNLANGI